MFPLNSGKKQYPNKLPNHSGFYGGHYFTWETVIFRKIYSRKQCSRLIRLLVKAVIKCLYCTVMYQVKYSSLVHRKVPIINGQMLGLNYFKNLLQAIDAAFNL